jgi:hypothetical protein
MVEVMSQPAETTPNLTFTMPESSKDTEKVGDKTEGSTIKSSQDTRQLEANVKSDATEGPSQNNLTLNVPVNIESQAFIKKGMFYVECHEPLVC